MKDVRLSHHFFLLALLIQASRNTLNVSAQQEESNVTSLSCDDYLIVFDEYQNECVLDLIGDGEREEPSRKI